MQEPQDEHQHRRILFSLATSITVGFISTLALIVFLDKTGIINQSESTIQSATIGWILVTAVLHSIFSVGLLRYDISSMLQKMARNILVAAAASFLFTIATSSYYGSQLNFFGDSWRYLSFLMTHIFPLWTFSLFVVVSVFSFDYSWRKWTPQPPIIASHA